MDAPHIPGYIICCWKCDNPPNCASLMCSVHLLSNPNPDCFPLSVQLYWHFFKYHPLGWATIAVLDFPTFLECTGGSGGEAESEWSELPFRVCILKHRATSLLPHLPSNHNLFSERSGMGWCNKEISCYNFCP